MPNWSQFSKKIQMNVPQLKARDILKENLEKMNVKDKEEIEKIRKVLEQLKEAKAKADGKAAGETASGKDDKAGETVAGNDKAAEGAD